MSTLEKLIRARLDKDAKYPIQLEDSIEDVYDYASGEFDALRAVLDLHSRIDVHPTIPGTEELRETPSHAICRECSDLDTAAALEFGDLIDMSDGERYPCKTVRAIAAAMGVTP